LHRGYYSYRSPKYKWPQAPEGAGRHKVVPLVPIQHRMTVQMTLSSQSQQALTSVRQKAAGQSVVFVSGNFNILHPGHIRLIRFAKQLGSFLVVAINGDEAPGVLFPQQIRVQGVESLSDVDFVVALQDPLESFLRELKPTVVVKGKEHETRLNLEKSVLESYGGKLIFSSGETKFSSVDLLRKEFTSTQTTLVKPTDFLDRHSIGLNDIVDCIQRLKGLKVAVIGDTIVDEYITCETLGLSQEDPTIVVSPVLNKLFVGGAGIVASHVVGLGGQVRFYSVLGNDKMGEFALNQLKVNGVETHLLLDESRPTTLKQRFRTQEKTLLRVNHLSQRSISDELVKRMYDQIAPSLDWADLIIFSDFNYGCLPQKLVTAITAKAKAKDKIVVADSQSSSQIGDITRFKDLTLVTPTEREARIGLRDFDSGLVVLAENLIKTCRTKHVFITLGAEGLFIHERDNEDCVTDKLPAFNPSPRDVAGAGDSLLVCSSMALATGANIWLSAFVASVASGCQVGRLGNVPLQSEEVLREVYH
jgi:rfaE bifunctional protein kinase chain/domain